MVDRDLDTAIQRLVTLWICGLIPMLCERATQLVNTTGALSASVTLSFVVILRNWDLLFASGPCFLFIWVFCDKVALELVVCCVITRTRLQV